MMNDWIEIGTIVAAQGLLGEVRIYPDSELPERFLEPGVRWLLAPGQAEPRQIEFLGGRYIPGKGLYVVELAGVENREQAEALRGCQLLVKSSDRPHLEEDEFYVLDLIGIEVINQLTGETLGNVINMISAGNDLLEVEIFSPPSSQESNPVSAEPVAADNSANNREKHRRKRPKPKRKPSQQKTILIPFVQEIVPVVDLESRRMEIIPPPGLLDL